MRSTTSTLVKIFPQSATIQVADGALDLVNKLPQLETLTLNLLTKKANESISLKLQSKLLEQTIEDLNQIGNNWPKVVWLHRFAPRLVDQFFSFWKSHNEPLSLLINHYLLNPHKILLIFQNSNELRPTGGFMGSYAIVNYQPGKYLDFVVEDIYDADGQFSGYVAAPPGVDRYLSSNHGMRLPDSNWSPDFRQSASQILEYFALGNRSGIDTVVAINHPTIEKILRVLGPITLPDYNATVTAETVSQLLQNRSDQFFPGSQRKKHLISQLLIQIIFRLENIKKTQFLRLASLVPQLISEKQLQFYSNQPQLQSALEKIGVAGRLIPPDSNTDALPTTIAWVESNVGINKVNQNVIRSIDYRFDTNQVTIEADFTNRGKKQYVDYQRLFIPTDWQLVSITTSKKEVKEIDQLDFENEKLKLKEIGFLMLVPAKANESVAISFSYPPSEKNHFPIYLFKQPGLPATPISISNQLTKQNFLLESDRLIP